jgi:hypothetical protein
VSDGRLSDAQYVNSSRGGNLNGQPEGRLFYGKSLVFRPGNHRYFWGGEPVPSVTTILGRLAKPALIQWAANMAVDYIEENWEIVHNDVLEIKPEVLAAARKAHAVKKDTAADLGSYTHAYAKDCFKANRLLPMPTRTDLELEFKKTKAPLDLIPKLIDGVIAGCEGFRDFFRKHTIHTIETERMVMYSAEGSPIRYAGRTDKFGRIDGKLGVLDIKTSGGIYDEFWLQLTAYEVALSTELKLEDPLMRWILHLDKNTGAHKLHERASSTPTIAAWLALVRFDQMMRVMGKVG